MTPRSGRAAEDRVFNAVLNAILDHRLAPGTKLVERDLSELLGVSRGAVRSALARLGHSLLVELRPNRGAVIANPTAAQMRDVFESIAAPATQGPMQMHSAAERRRLIQSVLDRLPVRYGDVLEWKYVDGDSVEQIGERLGIGHTAAQSMLARARTAFREALETVFGATVNDLLSGLPGSE